MDINERSMRLIKVCGALSYIWAFVGGIYAVRFYESVVDNWGDPEKILLNGATTLVFLYGAHLSRREERIERKQLDFERRRQSFLEEISGK